MGEIRINLSNFVAVGLMSFIAVWGVNKALEKFGHANWKA